jgi:hypothetical protein
MKISYVINNNEVWIMYNESHFPHMMSDVLDDGWMMQVSLCYVLSWTITDQLWDLYYEI